MSVSPRAFKAEVKEVHSGDDLVLMIDLGFDGLFKRVRVRLRGVDTPDGYKAPANTEAGEVRNLVQGLTRKKKCSVEVHSVGGGGWVVSLFLGNPEAECLNDLLISKGYIFRG